MYTIVKHIYYFYVRFLLNRIFCYIQFWCIRKFFYLLSGMKIGKGSIINMGVYVLEPRKIKIGNYSHINQGCILDGRGSLIIGNSVSISHRVSIITGSHDVNSDEFAGKFCPIIIDNYVWIGINATILQNVHIGKGAVIAACALVVKDIESFNIVGGVPCKTIGQRNNTINYLCKPKCYYL